ncbi:unnamed protein product [Schistosoma rodhaini]|nr:unnamed protein product [Schistosoma rodhaini]
MNILQMKYYCMVFRFCQDIVLCCVIIYLVVSTCVLVHYTTTTVTIGVASSPSLQRILNTLSHYANVIYNINRCTHIRFWVVQFLKYSFLISSNYDDLLIFIEISG